MKKKTKKLMKEIIEDTEEILFSKILYKSLINLVFGIAIIGMIKVGLVVLPNTKDEGIAIILGFLLLFGLYFWVKTFLSINGFLFFGGICISAGIMLDSQIILVTGWGIFLLGFCYYPFYWLKKRGDGK